MSQVEKETWSRTAIEIKPGASYRSKCVKVPNKNSMELSKEGSPCSRRPPVFLTPAAKKCSRVGVEQRPLQEWLVHLLALKPHRVQDVVLRLERANVHSKEQTEVLSTLEMVGQLRPKDGSYSLREELYSHVQKEWMGYTAEEKQHIAGILSRKQPNIPSARTFQTTTPSQQQGPPPPSYHNARAKPPHAKRPAPPENTDNESCKKARASHMGGHQISDQRSGHSSIPDPTSRHHTNPKTFKRPCSVTGNRGVYPLQSHQNQTTPGSLLKNHHGETLKRTKPCRASETDKDKLQKATSQGSQAHKRPDRHKDEKKEQDSSEEEEEEEDDWEEEALLLEQCLCCPEEKQQLTDRSPPPEDIPHYFKKYSPITSQDQRQVYEEDFASDYTEYLALHAKIGKVLERFVQLGSKMKKLQPGTVEHKMTENKILAEYKKCKKTHPGYSEEKTRCEYLHHKLSHIKHLILEYDKNMAT
ncbi:hypothetical protein FKM82_004808 [Ascaphus truei]